MNVQRYAAYQAYHCNIHHFVKVRSFVSHIYSTVYIFDTLMYRAKWLPTHHQGGVPGAVVKAACLESRRPRVRTPLWP